MMTQAMHLRQAIQHEAQRLGFHLFGITTPASPPHQEIFEQWLDSGRHGEMDYLATERARQCRADPLKIMPECRSILVLGMRYPASKGQDLSHKGELLGRVAAYATGEDYHGVFKERLLTLTAFIDGQVGAPVLARIYTDTGPVLERDLAQRAGLGWIGKNTCLIHPRQGSYFLLAEMLTSLDLPADPPFKGDFCGSCRRCLDACPTGCLLPDRTMDSRRCISYLTIELKGAIPFDLRPYLGKWIFGCDICQQVCPWNQRFASSAGDPAFSPRPGIGAPDLLAEMQISQEAFSRKFKGSPIKRARQRGYLRNVAVALGNLKQPAAVAVLASALLGEPEPLVRAHAAWALGRIGGSLACQALQQAGEQESEPFVRDEIARALHS